MGSNVRACLLVLALTGCTTQSVIPGPQPGDCYIADRTVNASPMVGASAVLEGRLITQGCVPVLKAMAEAKKAGVDLGKL